MEDGLVHVEEYIDDECTEVLILIVVEDGLVLVVPSQYGNSVQCLNPYCSGRWSRTSLMNIVKKIQERLNPYCSGRWSRTL